MKITCPTCAAEYNVPGVVAAGRVVRCAKCATEWTPVAPAAPAVMEPPSPSPEPSPPPSEALQPGEALQPLAPRPESRARPPGRWALLLAWIGSGGVVVAALVLAVLYRAPIMQAWPPSQRVYGALGLRAPASAHGHGDVAE